MLEVTKRAAGFGEKVVQVSGDHGVIGDYTAKVCRWPLVVIWGGLYTASGEFW